MNNEKQHTDIFPSTPETPDVKGIWSLFSNVSKKVLKMEYGKSMAFIFNIFGWTSVSINFFLFIGSNVDPFTRTIISLFSLFFLFIKSMNGVEKWYHTHYMNKEIRRRERVRTIQIERENSNG